jgi:serine O-acetyltransferase
MKMKDIAWNIVLLFSSIRLVPHILFLLCGKNKEMLTLDLERWSILNLKKKPDTARDRIYSFVKLMTFYPEYRNLFYYRINWVKRILYIFCRPMPTLYILTEEIGPGLFIQHGFSTMISAKKIGKNCWINQQVTIGYSNDTDCPTIGDDVFIFAGAKVIGNVSVGNNSTIGANAVVLRDVPDNCTVVVDPPHVIHKNGKKTNLYDA